MLASQDDWSLIGSNPAAPARNYYCSSVKLSGFSEPKIGYNTHMDNIEMFRKLSEIFSTGNTSEVGMLFDSLYLDHQKPDWLSVDGPDEFTQIVLSARKSLPNLKVEALEPVVADENVVVGRMSWKSDNT